MEKLDPNQIADAQTLTGKFSHRVNEVVNLMFGDVFSIEEHGDSHYYPERGNRILHWFWDGDEDSDEDNCGVYVPFEWLNMTNEELKALKASPEFNPSDYEY